MDDILSAALSESGLDEFFLEQSSSSPLPSTSESYSYPNDASNGGGTSAPAVTHDEFSNDGSSVGYYPSTSAYYPATSVPNNDQPVSFIGFDETDGSCTMIPKKEVPIVPELPQIQLIPRKRPPEVVAPTPPPPPPPALHPVKVEIKTEEPSPEKSQNLQEVAKPLHVQVSRTSEQHFENSCSPSPITPRLVGATTTQRSMTGSPASTLSTNSGSAAATSQVGLATNKLAPTGPIIRRTVHTKHGVHTQLLKPYFNEQGQKIYRVLNSVPPLPPPSARGAVTIRGTRPQNLTARPNERIVMVRQEGPNGQQVLVKKVLATTPNGGQLISSSPVYHGANPTVARRGAILTRATPRGNVIIRSNITAGGGIQRGGYTNTGYRVTNLVGRTGGSTMAHHHQPQINHTTAVASRMGRAGSVVGRTAVMGARGAAAGGGQVRYTTANVDRNGLHVSHSTPAFQYMDQDAVLSQRGPYPSHMGQKTSGGVVMQARHGQGVMGQVQQRVMMNRTTTNTGLNRLAGGYEQQELLRMNPQQSRLMIAANSVRAPGSGLSSPRMTQATYVASPLSAPVPQTKSQKAKDEMKMAYQMGREEALQQRKNDLEDDVRKSREAATVPLAVGALSFSPKLELKAQTASGTEENLGYADIYAEYTPAKLRSGMSHPDSVVESASLSSVAPPDVKYQVSIPEYLIDMGHISALQLEAVIYACQMHEKRMPSGERYGYLIGDGAGVGKGRTVASIIFENYIQGRKRAIWLSVSSDLKFDAERDLRDVGAPNIAVHALNKLKYAKISGKENGSIKKGVIFATYTSLIGECRGAKSRKYRSRIKQLIQWFGTDYDGVIILDECHRAKNLVPSTGGKPTKTGRMVLELQKMLPNARVVYASATGATEPRNMAYMTRLGLWGERQAFPEFTDFISAVERRGVGAMEIVAMDMKQRGLYLARQLSFRGVSFAVKEVELSSDFVKMYDDSVKLWMEARRQFQAVLESMDEEERSTCKTVWGQFWACHQRFFKYLCIAAKVDTCVSLAQEAVKAKKCVVVGLQSTGESATLETLEEMGGELNEFVSTAKAVLYGLIDKHFPTESSMNRDIFKDFDRMCDSFDRPTAKRRKANETLSFLNDAGFGTWSGATVGMSGRVGQPKKEEDANSTTSESSTDEESEAEKDDDDKSWDSAREEAEGARTLDDCEEDEWVKALLAEAESSSDSEEGEDGGGGGGEEEEQVEVKNEEKSVEEEEEEFNPFMCDFTNDDPWANNQQIIDDKPVVKKGKKRKRVDDEESERMKERRKRREERKEKKIRRAARKAEREKKRRIETLQSRGNASDFITSSKFCSTGDGEEGQSNINPTLVKTELLAAVERLAPALPANTLDQLIDGLGGPEYVAEMTGRRGHMITTETGEVQYERRNANAEVSLELINMEEKEKFMRGEKLIAIISEAASSGISLQSDRRALNKRRRVHITLELPWSADKAIQQFGRTHRSNQVSGPEYVFLISELAGEKRFASVVAKRLESLGALTHGDRRATTENRDLSQYNMDNKYGRVALDVLLKTVIGQTSTPLIQPPKSYTAGNFFEDMRLYMEGVGLLSKNKNNQFTIEKDSATIPKFLNRILGLPVHAQNALFNYFSEIVAELIAQSKHDGTYDTGIMDLGTGDHQVRKLETRIFMGRAEKGSFRVEMHKIGVERGVSWEEALSLYRDHQTDEDGFYVCQPSANGTGKKVVVLVYGIKKVGLDNRDRLYAITRPSTGRSPKLMTMADLTKRFSKVSVDEADKIWNAQYDSAATICQHSYIYGKCRTETSGTYCETGRRTRTYFVLSGSVLSVWPTVEEVLSNADRKQSRMQVIRVRTEQDQKIVGLLVLPTHVRLLVQQLEQHCGRSIVKTD